MESIGSQSKSLLVGAEGDWKGTWRWRRRVAYKSSKVSGTGIGAINCAGGGGFNIYRVCRRIDEGVPGLCAWGDV